MKTSFIIVGLVAVLLNSDSALAKQTPFASSLSARGFKAIAHRGTVTVYKHGSSSIIHIAAEGRLNAPPAEVRRVLLAYERQTRRIGRLSEARVMEGSTVSGVVMPVPVRHIRPSRSCSRKRSC